MTSSKDEQWWLRHYQMMGEHLCVMIRRLLDDKEHAESLMVAQLPAFENLFKTKIVLNLADEAKETPMEDALIWICGVLDKCQIDTKTVPIQELLDVLFDLKRNMEDE